MIRIIFDDGSIVNCEHINKIFIEECDEEKVTIVGSLLTPCETCMFSDCPVDSDSCVECDDRHYKEENECTN